jgi:hypothetical protein
MIWLLNRLHFNGSCARHGYGIFFGFPGGRVDIPQPVRRLSSPTLAPAWGKWGNRVPETEEAVRGGARPGKLLRSRMSSIQPAQITSI